MNKYLFLTIFIVIVILVSIFENASNKNKFKLNMLYSGYVNKFILLLIIVLIMMENIQLGILLTFTFFIVYFSLNNNQEQIQEGFSNYFSCR
jgi:hypothetical protein